MKKIRKILIILLLLLILSVGGFLIYASDYYRADDSAIAILNSADDITIKDNLTFLSTKESSNTGIIFYPGAKVEAIAYLPLLNQIRENGINSVLVKMPLNMAIFNSNAAHSVISSYPEITNWYIMGHSMGGAMASKYASDHPEKVKGLILIGAYIYGDYPPEKSLTIYGSFNSNLEDHIDYTDNIIVIDGGNHAKFGNYGVQKGDPEGTITHEEQQSIAVKAILDFIK